MRGDCLVEESIRMVQIALSNSDTYLAASCGVDDDGAAPPCRLQREVNVEAGPTEVPVARVPICRLQFEFRMYVRCVGMSQQGMCTDRPFCVLDDLPPIS